MKILHVVESLEMGGAEMVAVNLINSMREEHDLIVCCIKKEGPFVKRIACNIPIFCFDKGEGNDVKIPFRLAKIIRQNRIDVVHSHHWGVFCEAAWGGRMGGAKTIIHTAHGDLSHFSSNCLKKKVRRITERVSAILVDKIVTVSEYIRAQILSELSISPRKIMTIYNGIDTTNGVLPNFQKEAEERNELTLVTVGRLSTVKNYKMLLKAFKLAQDMTSLSMRLIFVGDGPEKVILEGLADRLRIANRVSFLGFRNDVERILASSDIFVLSSHYEGISMAILEAMRAGLPVIATSVGGNVESVKDEHTGVLVPDNDHGKFSEAIVKLASDSEKRKCLGLNGIRHVKETFNLKNSVKNYLNVYMRQSVI
jgi:sugar transferase (PEP-CTERM/EpsH1 system associated)